MKRLLLTVAAAAAAAVIVPLQAGVAAPPGKFTLSPSSLSLSAPAGSTYPDDYAFAYVTVTNPTGHPIVIQNPASFDDSHFFDTQTGIGSCWQTYEVFGNPIPGKASCTIQVGFHSTTEGTFTGTMTVYRCLSWTLNANGGIQCIDLDGSKTVSLTGTATSALPDLSVDAIAFTPDLQPDSYTVTVKNQGTGSADLTGVFVQGYYDPSAGTWPGADPACGTSFSSGTTLAAGATTDIVVSCSLAPGPADAWLNVKVDATDALTESDETNNVGSIALPA
jgi:hypothetical protein